MAAAIADTVQVSTDAWLPGFDGTYFYTKLWSCSEPKAVVIFVHGFADHISRYEGIHDQWAKRGVTVFAYDRRGFGRTALDSERKSADSSYGKTNHNLDIADLDWWVDYVVTQYPTLPRFVMGYSSGGPLVIAFAEHLKSLPNSGTITKVSGVIATSPLFELVHPPPLVIRTVVGWLVKLFPNVTMPAVVPEEKFSRDVTVVDALKRDLLRKPQGTLLGLSDMINRSIELSETGWSNWPPELPILIVHGAADDVNSPRASEAFINRLSASIDKTFKLIPDALHDLYHELGDVPQRVTEIYISWIEARI